MKRTDLHPIIYPIGISNSDRQFIRRVVNSVRDFINANHIRSILIGCSGGHDSVCLADICHKVQTINGGHFILSYVNHQLRPDENEKEKQLISNLGDKYNFPQLYLDAPLDKSIVSNIEAEARKKRYQILADNLECLDPYEGILLAHHRDDDFETIIMRLIDNKYMRIENKQSFQRVVYGMKQISCVYGCMIYRPLLGFRKIDLQRYSAINKLVWLEDSSNESDRFKRNQIRHHVIPILKKINKGF